MQRNQRRWLVFSLMVASVVFGARWVCGRGGGDFFDGDVEVQRALARGQARWVNASLSTQDFHTGADLFDGEWLFGTYMMSAMGLAQIAIEHPSLAATFQPALEMSLDQLLSQKVRAFDTQIWDEDALTTLDSGGAHAAYLGYLNLALGLERSLNPASRFADINDRITAALSRHLQASQSGLIETYPNQAYPVDTLAAVASVAQHARATETPQPAWIAPWVRTLRAKYVAHNSGLLIQAASPDTGTARDHARGSGTALGAYFAAYIDASLARELHVAVRDQLTTAPLGFGLVREYARGIHGRGDIDSGPLLMGYAISATGFSLGSARAASDRDHFIRIFRTATLFGAPHRDDNAEQFVSGGPLGNAIMLAMLTAPRLPTSTTTTQGTAP